MSKLYWLLSGALLACSGSQAAAQIAAQPAAQAVAAAVAQEKPNDGTDPTRPVRNLQLNYEHLDLRGNFTSDIMALAFTQPLGGRSSLRIKAPLSSIDARGDAGFALGDMSLKYTRIPVLTRNYGIVLQAEMIFDTASRAELGTGQNVLKPGIIYARFLTGGAIFAPAIVHSVSLWGDSGRPPVSVTTFDFYYVPHLANPKLYMTLDPAMNFDWHNDRYFPSLAVTLGRKLGKAMGGNVQAYVKPSAAFFADRPFNWGIEAGVQLLAF